MKANRIGLTYSSLKRKPKIVFHGLSFCLPAKGLVVITGDSGIGKTSLLSIISGQKKPTQGTITLPKIWQQAPPLYLEDQLACIGSWRVGDYLHQPQSNEALRDLGMLSHTQKKKFQALSGGQKIRLMVALFFSQPSACYLLDEPTHALDLALREKMITFLRKQSRERLVVIATHDAELIGVADHELKMLSAFQATWVNHPTQTIHPISSMIKGKSMVTHWLKKLYWLHRGRWLGGLLTFASMLIHIGLLVTGFIHQSLVQPASLYQQLERLEPFLTIQQVETTAIQESPFQLIKSFAPDPLQLAQAIALVEDATVLTSIAEWFPSTIEIQGVAFSLRFVDIPYQEAFISVVWIYPPITLPLSLALSTLRQADDIPQFHYQHHLQVIDQRPVKNWFESPQILLSYWQWLQLMQAETITINHVETTYLHLYQTKVPPSSVTIYDPSGRVKKVLSDAQDQHPWTMNRALEGTYALNHLLVDTTRTMTQILFLGLWILAMVVWWTRLHWIYQNHHWQWRWLLLLHVPLRKIWRAISFLTFVYGFILLTLSGMGVIFILDAFKLIPGSSVLVMTGIGFVIATIQHISRWLLLNWYAHA